MKNMLTNEKIKLFYQTINNNNNIIQKQNYLCKKHQI